jgi:hypothetical protein
MSDPTGVVISFLLDSTKEYIQYNVNLIDGLNDNIRQLMQDMGEMKTFVKECTEKYDDDDYLEKLANVVQDVVFQAEDTIEKYIVYSSRQKHRRTLDRTFHITEYWGELRAVGKECQQVSNKMQQLYLNKMPIAVKEIGNASGGSVKKRRIHSPAEDNIIGFEDVAEDVKKLLTGDNENLEVHSIVGMVGLGKTTLARKVYQDPEVEYKFFARAFVSVSQVYDRKEVFLKILSKFVAVTDEISKMHVDSIRDKIHEELNGKQYLIVLDDVWEENAWNDLKEVFPMNQKHSRVLITTRDSGVARHANPSTEPYSLRFMKDDEPKDLLRWKVFGSVGCPDDLEPHIKNYETLILEKCGGLPLAIVVVAGILLDRKTRVDWWKKVCDRVKISEHVAENISSELIGLSFNNLPYYMKPCFLYLGIFPEDFDIPVWKLIRLWIAEGFIQGKGNLDDIAERYLEEMVDRNLVMVAESKWNGQIKKCRVHDFLREFCKKEAMRRNLFQEVKGSTPVTIELSVDDYLRISINSDIIKYVCSKPSGKRLRSFLSFSKEETLLPAQHVQVIPKAFKLLRVFDARAVNFKSFPAELFYLILLKYIAMSCDIDTISAKLTNLWNLQTFIFETKSPTLNIKADIWQMEQFKNLHVNTSATLPPVPVQESTNQTTSNVQTLSDIAPESCTREVFGRCKRLKKLGIRGGNLAKYVNPPSGPGLFDNLSLLESLENLKLLNGDANVPLPFLPDHMKFPFTLNRLTLCRTSLSWDHMATLGELNNLMVLKLKDSAFVGDFWTVKDGGFSNLLVLHIEKTDLLKWEATSAHFPVLTTLVLKHCNRLTGIPRDFGKIASFRRIDLHWTPKVILSAKDIQVLKLQTQTEKNSPGFKLGVYPPESS